MSAPFFRKFALAKSGGDGRRPYLDETGACLGPGLPLLEKDGFGRWRARPRQDLERLLTLGYGEEVDLGWRMERLEAVARALNKGDLCLASIALLHAQLPDLPDPIWAARMAQADKLCKAGYNPAEPRDVHHQKWVAEGGAAAALAEAKKKGGWLWPQDVHRGNEKECVSLVRGAIPGLPHSGAWKKGETLTPALVQTNAIPSGTAIATFRNGRYNNTRQDHAVIYDVSGEKDGSYGIFVVDQWNGAKGVAERRFYPFVPNGTTHFLAGQFSVIAGSND